MTSKDWCYNCSCDRSNIQILKMAEKNYKILFQSYFVIIYQGMFPTVYFLTLAACFMVKGLAVCSDRSYV